MNYALFLLDHQCNQVAQIKLQLSLVHDKQIVNQFQTFGNSQ